MIGPEYITGSIDQNEMGIFVNGRAVSHARTLRNGTPFFKMF